MSDRADHRALVLKPEAAALALERAQGQGLRLHELTLILQALRQVGGGGQRASSLGPPHARGALQRLPEEGLRLAQIPLLL